MIDGDRSELVDIEHFESDNVNEYLIKNLTKANEILLIDGAYNYLKYDNVAFLNEALIDHISMVKGILPFMGNNIRDSYEKTLNTIKYLNRDKSMSSVLIYLINQDNLDISIPNKFQDYNYSIPLNLSYYNELNGFIKVLKNNEPISRSTINSYKKYNSKYFNELRGKLVGGIEVRSSDFVEELFKYFRSNSIDPSYINVNKKTVNRNIEAFKYISKLITTLQREYGEIYDFYQLIYKSLDEYSEYIKGTTSDILLSHDDNVGESEYDTLYAKCIKIKLSTISSFLSVYNVYFIEKMSAIRQMYKSYQGQCYLYYNTYRRSMGVD